MNPKPEYITRPLTIRQDGVEGIPNFFKRMFLLPLDLCLEIKFGPITMSPGGSIVIDVPVIVVNNPEE